MRAVDLFDQLVELNFTGILNLQHFNEPLLDPRFEQIATNARIRFPGNHIAICTNEFELYTDFGIQMKARSPAIQTFVIQLAGPGTYLPSERAMKHGGYGAVIQSSQIGPDGGQVLVERTVEALKSMWEKN
jgi:hypothetical protein